MSAPTVTTVVITAGNTPFLERSLRAVQAQKPGRVVLANWGKTALTGSGRAIEYVNLAKTNADKAFSNAGQVLRALVEQDPTVLDNQWLWILHDDCAPKPGCLKALLEYAEEGRTIGVVGPKQYAWDNPDQLLEVGITASRSARRLEKVAPGEIDQGQYDNTEDVLAVGTAGMLVSTQCFKELGGFDPALGPFGDGLEFCRRARLAGYRVVLAPAAGVEHARASYRDIRDGMQVDADASFGRRRSAQIYNAILAQSNAGMFLILLTLPFVTVLRSLWRLITQQPFLAGEEIKAGLGVYTQLSAISEARVRLRQQRQVPWRTLRPLEASNAEITRTKRTLARRERESRPTQTLEPIAAQLLRDHILRMRASAAVGTFLVLLASLFLTRQFTWGPTGGAWVALPGKYSELWAQAWAGWVQSGTGAPGPVDPLLPLMSVMSAPFVLLGISPNVFLIWLWKLAPALAWLSFFAASSALTQKLPWRVVAATVWICLPSFFLSWSAGFWAAALAHILLPLPVWGWLRCSDSSSTLVIRGASGEERIRTKVYATSAAAVAALATVGLASTTPWLALAALGVVTVLGLTRLSHLRTLVATVIPAFVYLIPTWIAAWNAPGAQGLRLLVHPSGGSTSFHPAAAWQLLLGLPTSTTSIETLHLPGWETSPVLASTLLWVAPGALCLAGGIYGLIALGRPGWWAQSAVLVAAISLTVAVTLRNLQVGTGRSPLLAWPAVAISLMMLALLVSGLRSLPDEIVVEKSRTYRARRRAHKAQQRRDRVRERQLQERAQADTGDDLDHDRDAANLTVVTNTEDAPVVGASAAHGETSGTDVKIASTDQPVLEASHALRSVSGRERILYPVSAVIATVTMMLPLTLVALWANDTSWGSKDAAAQADAGILTAVQPAPAHLTPAAAEEAQNGAKRSRLLVLAVDDSGTSAQLRRGSGMQLGETSPALQIKRAVAAAHNRDEDGSNALVSADLDTKILSQLVANLLTSPDTNVASQLHALAVEQVVLLPGSGSAWENAVTALSRNRSLASAGVSEMGQLWRARPNGQEPARARLVSKGQSVPVPSGVVGIHTDLSNLDWKATDKPILLVLAERADSHWYATINGQELKSVTVGWQQAFEVPEVVGVLRVRWWADWMLGWWIAVAITTAAMLVAVVPLRRRVRTNVS